MHFLLDRQGGSRHGWIIPSFLNLMSGHRPGAGGVRPANARDGHVTGFQILAVRRHADEHEHGEQIVLLGADSGAAGTAQIVLHAAAGTAHAVHRRPAGPDSARRLVTKPQIAHPIPPRC